jgi:hypothetical protein
MDSIFLIEFVGLYGLIMALAFWEWRRTRASLRRDREAEQEKSDHATGEDPSA